MKRILLLVLGGILITGCSQGKTETLCNVELDRGIVFKTKLIADGNNVTKVEEQYFYPLANEAEEYGDDFDVNTLISDYNQYFNIASSNALDGVEVEITADDKYLIYNKNLDITKADFNKLIENRLIRDVEEGNTPTSLTLENALAGFGPSPESRPCTTTNID